MEKCRELLVETVEVTEENVVSLIHLLIHYDQLEGLKDNVQTFIFTKWDELTESGTLEKILKHENPHFFKIGVQSVGSKCKCNAKK